MFKEKLYSYCDALTESVYILLLTEVLEFHVTFCKDQLLVM
jgi:hypothetical protein